VNPFCNCNSWLRTAGSTPAKPVPRRFWRKRKTILQGLDRWRSAVRGAFSARATDRAMRGRATPAHFPASHRTCWMKRGVAAGDDDRGMRCCRNGLPVQRAFNRHICRNDLAIARMIDFLIFPASLVHLCIGQESFSWTLAVRAPRTFAAAALATGGKAPMIRYRQQGIKRPCKSSHSACYAGRLYRLCGSRPANFAALGTKKLAE